MSDSYDFVFFDPHFWTEEDLLNILKKSSHLLKEGKTILSWSGEGNEAQKQFVEPIAKVVKGVQRCLKLKNPAVYGRIVRGSTQYRTS